MSRRYFGTDGIRGKVGESMLTPEFVMKLGWAAGQVLCQPGEGRVLIGKDTRISGYMFESALEAGFSAAGVDIRLLGPMPTPAIAYLTQTLRASAGIVISASHNPYYDNGIKFLSHSGKKLPDATELAIEALLDQPMRCVESAQLGKAARIVDAAGRYIEFCKSKFPSHLDLSGLKIVVDCAHGATYQIAPKVLAELGAHVTSIGVTPDGVNINDHCGAVYPQTLQKTVLELGADIGIALDGDGDRLIMVDASGEVLDGDDILFILARQRLAQGDLAGGIVGTQMTNFGLELAFREMNIAFRRAKVGDRYVLEMLEQENWCVGGETSGHIICLDKSPTGDGIVAALQVLAVVVASGQSLAELRKGWQKLPQILVNVPLASHQNSSDVLQHSPVQAALQVAEQRLASSGRVLLRPSGTEPLIRVMVEGRDPGLVKTLAEDIAIAVRRA
ncbi:MAG: phosphoglucosamine mutase [Gammaproteobacteria bacterium]|nr:phosphoglucosamine mutase [Gammaproteobacteria bacterium]